MIPTQQEKSRGSIPLNPLLMVPRWFSGHLGAIPIATWSPSHTPRGESGMDRPDTWTVMVTWLPSMTLRSERPCRKMGATGLLGAGGGRCSLSPLLFFSVLWEWNRRETFYSFTHSTNTLDDRVVLKLGSHACWEALENTGDKAGPMSLLDVMMFLLDSRD